ESRKWNNNNRFKIIIQEFHRAVKYLYKADLELCCEIYYEREFDEFEYCDGIPIITLKTLREYDKFDYCEDGIPIITLETLHKVSKRIE
ncbi:23776_t:CDS:1, partial [Gigaspora margarita]